MPIANAIQWIWVSVGILWALGAVSAKRAQQVQSGNSRRIQVGLTLAGFFLMFSETAGFGILAWRFVPQTPLIEAAGLLLTLLGCLFAIWARVAIGRNWSASVTIKQQHRLITSGPYAVVRHPIYSGLLLALTGSALAFGEVRDLFAILFVTFGWWLKTRVEETFMVKEFGSDYLRYKQRVRALIPKLL